MESVVTSFGFPREPPPGWLLAVGTSCERVAEVIAVGSCETSS